MRRRSVLAGAGLAGLAGLSGCGGLRGLLGSGERSGTTAGSRTQTRTRTIGPSTLAGPPVSQSVTVGNTTPRAQYVTVAVARGSTTAFAESTTLLPGEQVRYDGAVTVGGAYDVVVETAAGRRRTAEWTVDGRLDGLSVLLADGVEVWPRARCRGGTDCELARDAETADLPLIGDGSTRWYAPAGVLLENAADAPRTVGLRVTLSGEPLVAADYELPGRSRLDLPLTYRSGAYEVAVSTGGTTARSSWPVPEVPSRHVRLDDGVTFGCGPANTVLRVGNAHDRPHRLELTVATAGGEVRYERTFDLDPDERTEVEPVATSGEYVVAVAADTGASTTETWWSCPPHGPGSVVLDATGSVWFSQGYDGGRT
jgi:hypothetical protein